MNGPQTRVERAHGLTAAPPVAEAGGASAGLSPRAVGARGLRPHPNRVRGAAKSRAKYQRQAAGRREDFAWLRKDQRITIGQAAERVGVSYRQAQRYEATRQKRREAVDVT